MLVWNKISPCTVTATSACMCIAHLGGANHELNTEVRRVYYTLCGDTGLHYVLYTSFCRLVNLWFSIYTHSWYCFFSQLAKLAVKCSYTYFFLVPLTLAAFFALVPILKCLCFVHCPVLFSCLFLLTPKQCWQMAALPEFVFPEVSFYWKGILSHHSRQMLAHGDHRIIRGSHSNVVKLPHHMMKHLQLIISLNCQYINEINESITYGMQYMITAVWPTESEKRETGNNRFQN